MSKKKPVKLEYGATIGDIIDALCEEGKMPSEGSDGPLEFIRSWYLIPELVKLASGMEPPKINRGMKARHSFVDYANSLLAVEAEPKTEAEIVEPKPEAEADPVDLEVKKLLSINEIDELKAKYLGDLIPLVEPARTGGDEDLDRLACGVHSTGKLLFRQIGVDDDTIAKLLFSKKDGDGFVTSQEIEEEPSAETRAWYWRAAFRLSRSDEDPAEAVKGLKWPSYGYHLNEYRKRLRAQETEAGKADPGESPAWAKLTPGQQGIALEILELRKKCQAESELKLEGDVTSRVKELITAEATLQGCDLARLDGSMVFLLHACTSEVDIAHQVSKMHIWGTTATKPEAEKPKAEDADTEPSSKTDKGPKKPKPAEGKDPKPNNDDKDGKPAEDTESDADDAILTPAEEARIQEEVTFLLGEGSLSIAQILDHAVGLVS